MIILETPRLRLRRFTYDDAPFILELLNEPSFLRFERMIAFREGEPESRQCGINF